MFEPHPRRMADIRPTAPAGESIRSSRQWARLARRGVAADDRQHAVELYHTPRCAAARTRR